MIISKTFCIGVMSGTSLDGVDLVYCSFNLNSYNDFEIIHAKTISYPLDWYNSLKNAIHFSKLKLEHLHVDYGKYLGLLINEFVAEYKIKKLDFIASHGHTVLHEPDKGITLQVGDGNEISKLTKAKVVYDFRAQDVKLGGQGAPLVPVGDELLFSDYNYCLNLGGFSNISFNQESIRIAFDICPVNIVLNHYVKKIGYDFDESGKIAATGKVNAELLNRLNSIDFYNKNPPKSLGLEWVQKEIFPLIDSLETENKNILRTFVEHIAIQIGKIIVDDKKVLVTGGGVFNSYLIKRIEFYAKTEITLVDDKLIDFKEALIFSFLGLLKINNEINCLKSVTGASIDHSSGVVVEL